MDDEFTAGYREPCAVCSAVDWGVSNEGRFYCRSCHNVIERTREVTDPTFTPGSNRITTISRGTRTERPVRGRQWAVCEGFQFILRNQANALVKLGVNPRFKDEVLCELWRIYLQKSRQAFTDNPARTARFTVRGPDSDSESAADLSGMSASETDGDMNLSASNAGSASEGSLWSGSEDAASYLSTRGRRSRDTVMMMSMRKTLALIHLALVWSREPLTLGDLLRLVNEGHVPYLNAYEELPDEMKLEGKDSLIFTVKCIPRHHVVYKEARALLLLLQLPAFPPISRQSLLHPALLSLRYLTDANLPDELHPWVCRLMRRAGMESETLNTFDLLAHPILPQYDVQAAALIIITMKLIFGLDDHTEWDLSNEVGDQDDTGNMFNLRRWFRLVQAALIRAQQRKDHDIAKKQWTAKKPIYCGKRKKCIITKRKRTAEQVQICFERLSSRPADVQRVDPSSFRFCWGDQDGADGPSLHQKTLAGVMTLSYGDLTPCNSAYWQPAFRDKEMCPSVYKQLEARLPRTFVWLLELFCFLLDVKPAYLLEEVQRVEKLIICHTASWQKRKAYEARIRERGGGPETEETR